jgi:hypothetical protein
MASNVEVLMETLQQEFPSSHVRLLPEPAMFLRSNLGRSYHAEGMQFLSVESAMAHVRAYMNGLVARISASDGFELNETHPWIIGVYPGDLTSAPLVFIFGNIIRSGKEEWVQIGFPRYENLEFNS